MANDSGTTTRDGGISAISAIRISPRAVGVPGVIRPPNPPRGSGGRLGIPNRIGAGRRVKTR